MPSKSQRRIALVDGNNFFVSCERLFQPALQHKPVIVLSNNDGCAVSRSEEAKALGVKMAEPFFKISSAIKRQGLVALSSNYTLYADISNRMMRLLGEAGSSQEISSIDECFIDLSHLSREESLAASQNLRAKVLQGVGIPTCIGIGPSKTLAKLANHVAKKNLMGRGDGVWSWELLDYPDTLLGRIPVGEVWGVGRHLRGDLEAMGIRTALQLKKANSKMIQRRFSVSLARTVDELNGHACLLFEDVLPNKQSIMTSRSFAQTVNNMDSLAAAITDFASRSAEKMRQQACVANTVNVFAYTDRFANQPQYFPSLTIPLSVPTDDTLRIVKAALYGLKHFYRAGYEYKKAGVLLGGLEKRGVQQLPLFSRFNEAKSGALMHVMDAVNAKYGGQTLRLAATIGQFAQAAAMRRDRKSQNFTTDWKQLAEAW